MKLLLVADLSLHSDANCVAASSEANANALSPPYCEWTCEHRAEQQDPATPVFGSLLPREAAIQIRHESPTMDAHPL